MCSRVTCPWWDRVPSVRTSYTSSSTRFPTTCCATGSGQAQVAVAAGPDAQGQTGRVYSSFALNIPDEKVKTQIGSSQRTTIEGESPDDVANSLGISRGLVYVARSRVIRRLRDEIEKIRVLHAVGFHHCRLDDHFEHGFTVATYLSLDADSAARCAGEYARGHAHGSRRHTRRCRTRR